VTLCIEGLRGNAVTMDGQGVVLPNGCMCLLFGDVEKQLHRLSLVVLHYRIQPFVSLFLYRRL